MADPVTPTAGRPAVMPRRGFLPRPGSPGPERPMRINPQPQPANRQDGRYMEFGEIPNPGERPVTPLWERPPGNFGGEGDIEFGITGGGAATAGHANATTRQVQGNELVAQQLNQLTAGDSPYIRQARQQGLLYGASRGLMGSMSGGNAVREAIKAGLPIAQADAAWYGRTSADNMDAQNAASLANAQNDTSASIASAGNQSSLAGAILRSRQDREQAALERNYGRERGIWDSEEGERQDFRREGIDDRSDWRRSFLGDRSAERSDFRREGIDSRTDVRRYGLDARSDDRRRRNENRDYLMRTIIDQVAQNPEEWDRDQISGVIDYFSQYGDELYDETFDDIFGQGEP